MKILMSALLCLMTITSYGKSETNEKPFLTAQQQEDFYNLLISEIERLDAEIIETRNNSKNVSWREFVDYQKDKFLNAKDWDELYQTFDEFHDGLVNLHSSAIFLAYEPEPKKSQWLNSAIWFEYPIPKFYLAKTKQPIVALNKKPIGKLFKAFSDYRCRHNNEAGCVADFARRIEAGAITVDGAKIKEITLSNGNEETVEYEAIYDAPPKSRTDYMSENYCDAHSGYEGFTSIFKGQNACLYSKEKTAVLRLRHFIYPDHQDPSIYCDTKDATSSYCSDINGVLAELKKHNIEHLVFDMTHNIGGMENSPLLAAFMPDKFKDLTVAYKNTKEIHNPTIRQELFYGNPKGENWYQKSKNVEGEYFAPRADFCQGADDCSLEWIEPRKDAFKAEKISIISDWKCVSSCDDFVWRMQDYAGAEVYGIAPAQDATYARIKLYLYLGANGQVQKKVVGEMTEFKVSDKELLLAEVKMPYSKTVTEEGKLRNTEPVNINVVPYTISNRKHYASDVLRTILE